MISLPSNLSSIVAQAMDTLLLPKGQGGLAERCVLFYPPLLSSTSVPQLVPAGGLTSDLYPDMTSMTLPDDQNSSLQFGDNLVSIEQSEVIYLTIEWKPTTFNQKLTSNSRYPDGSILTRGYVTDLQKVMNCNYMEIFQEAGFNHFRFKLMGEPSIPDQLTDARYFYAYWSRA